MGTPSCKFEIIHDALEASENRLSVSELCRIAGVSRSGYYNWLASAELREEKEARDRADFQLILEAYTFRGYNKGVRGINMRLLHLTPPVIMNPKKIRRLMRKYGLNCPIRKANPYRRMAKAMKTSHVSDNLLNREFEAHGPRYVLLTDITYIPLNDGFCYLSTILDAFTKQVLSYVLSESLEVDFVLVTVTQLIEKHSAELNSDALIHSDQGCHYTSHKFIQILKDKQLRQSMSRRGNCWDNAPQESFFGHMKDELAEKIPLWNSFQDAKADIDDWIDYYNNDRYQWQLAKLSPNEFYKYYISGVYPLQCAHDSPPAIDSAPRNAEESLPTARNSEAD